MAAAFLALTTSTVSHWLLLAPGPGMTMSIEHGMAWPCWLAAGRMSVEQGGSGSNWFWENPFRLSEKMKHTVAKFEATGRGFYSCYCAVDHAVDARRIDFPTDKEKDTVGSFKYLTVVMKLVRRTNFRKSVYFTPQ